MVFRRSQAFPWGIAGLVGTVLVTGAATPEAQAQVFPAESTARGVTVTTRPRPEYDPLGVRIGAFRLDASAELGLGYDDNVFGTRNNRTGDGFFDWNLRAGLESDWTRHGVGVTASVAERRYFSETPLNWTDWSVGAFGRLDIGGVSSIEARYSHQRLHLDVTSIDVQQAGVGQPSPYDVDEFRITGNTRLNRLALTGLLSYQIYQFDNVEIGGVTQPLDENNYQTWLAVVGAGYAFAPGRLGTLVARIQDIRYDKAISRGRDSFTWEVLVGFQYDFDGVWQARAGVGYRQRNYDSPTIKNLEGPAFEGQVIWAPSQITTVTLGFRRTIEESINRNQVGYNRTLVQANVDHELRRNVILGLELGAIWLDYQGSNLSATDGYLILTGRWLLNRNMALTASYQYVNRFQANGGAEQYYRNLFQVGVRFAI
ncbi:MAG: outer membrane beta-barrel protein [Acetobacteraceae bacterium]|nr:outer membrane beta-barrel protein [Acetobacteraceae bacterium]